MLNFLYLRLHGRTVASGICFHHHIIIGCHMSFVSYLSVQHRIPEIPIMRMLIRIQMNFGFFFQILSYIQMILCFFSYRWLSFFQRFGVPAIFFQILLSSTSAGLLLIKLFCFCMSLRSSEIILFWNLQLFYWHFLEILWIFIFILFYFFSL